MNKRIEEFTEYGEIDMMKQYVDDAKNVQKRITEAEATIDWIRNVIKESLLIKSTYN